MKPNLAGFLVFQGTYSRSNMLYQWAAECVLKESKISVAQCAFVLSTFFPAIFTDDKPNVKTPPTHRTIDLRVCETCSSIKLFHSTNFSECFYKVKCRVLILACRTKHAITYMDYFQGRSSAVVLCPLSSHLFPPLPCLSSSHYTLPSLFVSVSFCGLQSRSWSQPCCRVPVLV